MITENEVLGELKRTQREFDAVRESVEKLLDTMTLYCEEHFLLAPLASEPVKLREASERMRAVLKCIDKIRSARRVSAAEFDSPFTLVITMERVAEQLKFFYQALDAIMPPSVPLNDVGDVTEGLRRFREGVRDE